MVEGLSQEQLAKKLGVSSMSIHSYEHKKRTPSMKLYPKLIELYPNFKDQILDITTDEDGGSVTKGEHHMPEQYSLQQLITSNENNQELIQLQKEKIAYLEKEMKSNNRFKTEKPAYHFKMVSRYIAETDEWLDTDIFGDFAMTGYTYEEIVPIMNEENNCDSWLDRYHPDSRKRLNDKTLKDIKTDFHHLQWDHMMWMAKDGTYKCYNIDLLYIRAKEQVTSMFYWVNGDSDS